MEDFYEIDFLNVESPKSGDAITLRYRHNGSDCTHVVDGGFQATGEYVCAHIREHYQTDHIDHVVATHSDGDHAGGLRLVLEEFEVGTLWMLRPWIYAENLIDGFPTYNSVERLASRLRSIYPNIVALEEIALRKGIQIKEPFQGANIGAFVVCSPTIERYVKLLFESEKTPESEVVEASSTGFAWVAEAAKALVRAAWGVENFSDEDTSAENDMSVVQFADICSRKLLLTGDTGRAGLTESADYVESLGVALPGLRLFDVPHHGSRRNVSSETLDRWLGAKVQQGQKSGCSAIVSASREDATHPRKVVVRACIHRGAVVATTENGGVRHSHNAPHREGWTSVTPIPYPEDYED